MATFPIKENDITVLAETMTGGLTSHPDIFPSPPVIPVDLANTLDAFKAAAKAALEAQAAAEKATEAKLAALEMLVQEMKSDIRYAENQTGGVDDQLKLIGWGAKKTPVPLSPPGQPRYLTVTRQGETTVELNWKRPDDGGSVAYYKVQRRERPAGPWTDATTVIATATTLAGQERGKEYEYCVIAVNKVGQSEPSNIDMAVL